MMKILGELHRWGLWLFILLLISGCQLMSKELVGSPADAPSPKAAKEPRSEDSLGEAQAAFAQGEFSKATALTEHCLKLSKSEGVPEAELLNRKEYLAKCQYKAKHYEEACLSYNYLAKKLKNKPQLAETARLVRQEYWRKELQPKLKEAERHRANGRFERAKRFALEVKALCKKAGLDTGPADSLLAYIDQSSRATLGRAIQKRQQARMNEVIPVRIQDGYNYGPFGGRTEKMTRREYIRRKNLEKQGKSWSKPRASVKPKSSYPKANKYPRSSRR
jgi:hypothetical protein